MAKRKLKSYLQICVLIIAYGYVGMRIFAANSLNLSGFLQRNHFKAHIYLMVIALLLVMVNWLIEAYKWQLATSNFCSKSVKRALSDVLYGAGVGLFTPNRIGDPVGRVAMLQPQFRTRGAAVAVVCSTSQLLATIVFGVVGILLWSNFRFPFTVPMWLSIMFIAILLIVILSFLFFYKDIFAWAKQFKAMAKLMDNESVDAHLSRSMFIKIIAVSFLRYAIFSTQLVMLMFFFGYSGSVLNLYPAIFVSYLFSSIVPTFALAEAGVKAGFAVIFIGAIWPNPLAITLASASLWLANVAIPALVGVWVPFASKRQ